MAGNQGTQPTPYPLGHKAKVRITADEFVRKNSAAVESGDSGGSVAEQAAPVVTSEGSTEAAASLAPETTPDATESMVTTPVQAPLPPALPSE